MGQPHFNVLYTVTAVLRSGQMFSWYSNKQMDDLIDAAKQTVDPKKHEDTLRRLLRLMTDDPPLDISTTRETSTVSTSGSFGNLVPTRISTSTEPM
jgi:ABC-type transport system substrate-binding protein